MFVFSLLFIVFSTSIYDNFTSDSTILHLKLFLILIFSLNHVDVKNCPNTKCCVSDELITKL